MNHVDITTHAELLRRIVELKETKDIQEYELKVKFRDFMATIDFVSIFKTGFLSTGNHSIEFAKTGITLVVNLIIKLVLGKNRSIKGFLSALLIEKFTSSLINNNLAGIIATISSLLSRKTQFEKSQEFYQ